MKRLAILSVAIGLVAFAAVPAEAACGSLRQIGSLAAGQYSYIYTPGFDAGGAGLFGSTVSENVSASFWHVGNGDLTALGLGNDNGSWAPVNPTGYYYDGWIRPYPNGYAYINGAASHWATAGIDGCIDNPLPDSPTERCMAVMINDVDADGNAVWALVTESADDGLNYASIGNGNPINLVPMPTPNIVTIENDMLRVEVPSGDMAAGLYLDDGDDCAAVTGGGQVVDLVAGVNYFYILVPQGSSPPTQLTGDWVPFGVDLGMYPDGYIPLDTAVDLDVPTACGGATDDLYIGAQIIFDSGATSWFVSGGSETTGLFVACDSTLAEPSGTIRIREEQPNRTNRRRSR